MIPFSRFKNLKELVKDITSRSRDISRKNMPQIDMNDMDDFLQHLENNNVRYIANVADAQKYNATQNQFNINKIESMMQTKSDSPILVSADKYIIDGHHRWLASFVQSKPINVIEIQTDIDSALHVINNYDNVKNKSITERYETINESTNSVNKLVYHGTNAKFDKFTNKTARIVNDFYGGGTAYFTSDINIAHQYAKAMQKKYGGDHYVYECKISLKNCFDVDKKFTGEEFSKIFKLSKLDAERFARNAGLLVYGADKYRILSEIKSSKIVLSGDEVFKGLSSTIRTAFARDILIKAGYDGLRYNGGLNMKTSHAHDVYLIYDADDIKIQKIIAEK